MTSGVGSRNFYIDSQYKRTNQGGWEATFSPDSTYFCDIFRAEYPVFRAHLSQHTLYFIFHILYCIAISRQASICLSLFADSFTRGKQPTVEHCTD